MIRGEVSEARARTNTEERSQPPRPMVGRGCGDRISTGTSRRSRTKREGRGDPVRCTGRQCRSCTGGAVADCVAICCCPCAVLNCLALAFVKIPFLIGKRWCRGLSRKRRRKKNGRKPESTDCETKEGDGGVDGCVDSWIEIGFEEGAIGDSTGVEVETVSETEKVWLDLCEFDHMSFGRVSFAGIPLQT